MLRDSLSLDASLEKKESRIDESLQATAMRLFTQHSFLEIAQTAENETLCAVIYAKMPCHSAFPTKTFSFVL